MDQLSSELLGFAPDARVLIVNCDDFGMHDAVNAAVVESIENGIASSCSLIVPCPAAANAMRLLRERPHIPFGIDVERELRAQIDAVVDTGLAPTHLDWHCLADGGRTDILDLAIALAKEYGLAARVWLDDGRRKARQQGKPVVDNAFLDSYSISLRDKAATYARTLRDLPPGLNEWAIHPAHGTEPWQTIEPTGWQIRQSDHAFLTSPQAREIVDHEGITVIDYRPLQQAWNACTDPSPRTSR